MSTATEIEMGGLHLAGAAELRRKWGWFVALGIVLVILGMIALGSALFVTLASMLFFGWLMIFGGIVEAVHAFSCKRWSGFFLDLLTGLLYVVVGFIIVNHPLQTAVALTLLIAMFLLFSGIFRIVVAFSVRYQNRWWIFFHGFIDVVLGFIIWQQWPESSLWIVGMFIGIDMLFNGWSLVMLGLAAKNIPANGSGSNMPSGEATA